MLRRKVCITIDWFLPGTNSGGPVRSVANLVAGLPEIDFYILTRDHDYCSTVAYDSIQPDQWSSHSSNVQVYYVSEHRVKWANIKDIIARLSPDAIYISGIYSDYFSVSPVFIARRLRIPAIIASRGMLSPHALAVKPIKKKLFLMVMRLIGAYRGVKFHATSSDELWHIADVFGKRISTTFIPNLPRTLPSPPPPLLKQPGSLKLIYLGRIAPEKGTLEALEALQAVTGSVEVNIYGTCYDEAYWNKCRMVIESLPSEIRVTYYGPVDPESEAYLAAIHSAHALLLPSKGENYGHAIVECLSQGKPVIIGRQTPWKQLQAAKAGFDVDTAFLVSAIQTLVDLDQEGYDSWSLGAYNFYEAKIGSEVNAYKKKYSIILTVE